MTSGIDDNSVLYFKTLLNKKVSKAIYNIDFQIIERILRLIENFQLMLVLVYEDLDENLQISVWFIML